MKKSLVKSEDKKCGNFLQRKYLKLILNFIYTYMFIKEICGHVQNNTRTSTYILYFNSHD